jgi:hypothetical protein
LPRLCIDNEDAGKRVAAITKVVTDPRWNGYINSVLRSNVNQGCGERSLIPALCSDSRTNEGLGSILYGRKWAIRTSSIIPGSQQALVGFMSSKGSSPVRAEISPSRVITKETNWPLKG